MPKIGSDIRRVFSSAARLSAPMRTLGSAAPGRPGFALFGKYFFKNKSGNQILFGFNSSLVLILRVTSLVNFSNVLISISQDCFCEGRCFLTEQFFLPPAYLFSHGPLCHEPSHKPCRTGRTTSQYSSQLKTLSPSGSVVLDDRPGTVHKFWPMTDPIGFFHLFPCCLSFLSIKAS